MTPGCFAHKSIKIELSKSQSYYVKKNIQFYLKEDDLSLTLKHQFLSKIDYLSLFKPNFYLKHFFIIKNKNVIQLTCSKCPTLCVCVCVCVHTHIYTYTHVYIFRLHQSLSILLSFIICLLICTHM